MRDLAKVFETMYVCLVGDKVDQEKDESVESKKFGSRGVACAPTCSKIPAVFVTEISHPRFFFFFLPVKACDF